MHGSAAEAPCTERDPRKLGAHAVRGRARGREGPRALLQRSELARYDDERAAGSSI